MKEVLAEARRIIIKKRWHLRWEKRLRKRHQKLYDAGVANVPDPDLYQLIRPSQLDDDMARHMGLIPPKRGGRRCHGASAWPDRAAR